MEFVHDFQGWMIIYSVYQCFRWQFWTSRYRLNKYYYFLDDIMGREITSPLCWKALLQLHNFDALYSSPVFMDETIRSWSFYIVTK